MMKKVLISTAGVLMLLATVGLMSAENPKEITSPSTSTEQSITLSVEKMNCFSCPYIVKKSLLGTEGVKTAEVTLADKKAVITFDAEATNVEMIIAATANVGFPSKLIEPEND
jgi:mercuric ion binding protein